MELQLRALDAQTKFVSGLRSGPAGGVPGAASAADSLVFYVKMLADYRRLLAEFLSEREYESAERARQSVLSLAYYTVARFVASQALPASSPIRLGLALNHSVFLHEVMAQPDRACQLAKNAYDMALQEHKQQQQALDGAGAGSTAAGVATAAGGGSGGAGNAAAASSVGGGGGGGNAGGGSSSSGGVGPGTGSSAGDKGATVGGPSATPILKDSLLIMQLLKNNLSMWTETT